MSCPITKCCFDVINTHCFSPGRQQLFEDVRDRWSELETRISTHTPKVTTKRLRGFYSIEVMYHLLLPSLYFPLGGVGYRSRFLQSRFARDHAGLGELIALCAQAERELTIEHGELELDGSKANTFIQSRRLHVTRGALAHCERAARLLRPMLRGTTQSMGAIGAYLGEVILCADSANLDVPLHYLNTMLDVSIHNPVSPWTMKSYPVLLSI